MKTSNVKPFKLKRLVSACYESVFGDGASLFMYCKWEPCVYSKHDNVGSMKTLTFIMLTRTELLAVSADIPSEPLINKVSNREETMVINLLVAVPYDHYLI